MSSIDACRRDWSLKLAVRERSDIVVWVVPCFDLVPDETRHSLPLRYHPHPVWTIDKQQREALDFLLNHCGSDGVTPRALLVVVWHQRSRKAKGWGYLSTAHQLRHPTVIFRNECRPFPPPAPSTSSYEWTWNHLFSLSSPQPRDDDDRDLRSAIRYKARIVQKLQQRDPLTQEETDSLDGGFMDLESSRVLVCKRLVSVFHEKMLMEERLMGSLRSHVPRFVDEALDPSPDGTVSIFHHAVLPLISERRLFPMQGRIALNPAVAVQLLTELWRQEHQLGTPSYEGLEEVISQVSSWMTPPSSRP
jgi:hypothetical protein